MPTPKRDSTAAKTTPQTAVGHSPTHLVVHGRHRMKSLRRHVEHRLERELPKTLHYHGPHHTIQDVVPSVERLSDGEGVQGKDRDILVAAALFHDMGFIEAYNGNEPIGARMAADTLPLYGFTHAEITRVRGLILATEMKEVDGIWRQVPGDDVLKRILCDADLDNLGRQDFFEVSDSLRRELSGQGTAFTELGWLTRQILFVSQQEWFTSTQIAQRQAGKDANLATLRENLGALL